MQLHVLVCRCVYMFMQFLCNRISVLYLYNSVAQFSCWEQKRKFESKLLFFKLMPPLCTILLHCTCTCVSTCIKSLCVYVHVFFWVTSMKLKPNIQKVQCRSFFLWKSATFVYYTATLYMYVWLRVSFIFLCLSVLSGRVRGIWNQTYNLHPLPGHGTGPCLRIHVENWLLYTHLRLTLGGGQTDMQW